MIMMMNPSWRNLKKRFLLVLSILAVLAFHPDACTLLAQNGVTAGEAPTYPFYF